MKSEIHAYNKGGRLLGSIHMDLSPICLDRYYLLQSYIDKPGDKKVYVIRKNNLKLNGSRKWKDTMKKFVENTIP